jgi:hypothetical protein
MAEIGVGIGDQVFAGEGADPVGAVRRVHAHELIVFIEGTGDLAVPATAVAAVHDGKVVLDERGLSPELRRAIAQAHRGERPGL